MKKDYTTVDYVAFSILGGVLVIAVFYAAFGWKALAEFLWDPAVAAWVQAIGSIGAILGAGAVAGWQARTARRDQQQARDDEARAKAAAVKGILRRANVVINNAARNVAGDAPTVALAIEQVDLVQAALRRLPAFEMPSAELVFLLHRLDRDLHYVVELLRRFPTRPTTDARLKTAQKLIERIRGRTREVHAACDALLVGRAATAETVP